MPGATPNASAAAPRPSRWRYYQRILSSYIASPSSQLTFWHDAPEVNDAAFQQALGEYFMPFTAKSDYGDCTDPAGVPMLDYHGAIGRQYNPIAIAQYGLGNFNQFLRTGSPERQRKFLLASDWLLAHLEPNPAGLWVWNHYFDWEYRTPLRAPWYSGLAQGQGISLLLRAHRTTGKEAYLEAAKRAYESLARSVNEGGTAYVDARGDTWIEEYVVDPPTHILNGFLWTLWGVWEYARVTADPGASALFNRCIATLRRNLPAYDTGYWSLYEQSGTRLPMLASPFYHRLHIVQLRVLHRLTGEALFAEFADRWEAYVRKPWNRRRAWIGKAIFKLCNY